MLAHELAHVVQQEHGRARGDRRALEAEAEQSARSATLGERLPLPARIGRPMQTVQGFDPAYHEQATIGGATGIFTPEETGKIYEANWRRDFSQGWPEIADIVLAWREVREYANLHRGKTDSGLQWKLIKAVANLPKLATDAGNTYGGYRYWEHMDNPGAADAAEADQRWGTGPGDLPGYIRDSRASIKDKLAASIQAARDSWGGLQKDSGRARADAWAKGAPPADYDMWNAYQGRSRPPMGFNTAMNVPDPQVSSQSIANQVTGIAAQQPGAKTTGATKGFSSSPEVADNLGRASHLVEDFFAHSNFVELTQTMQPGKAVSPSALKTGTFDTPDKLHSLSGKLRDAADDMAAHKDLIPVGADTMIEKLRDASRAAEGASHAMHPGPGSHTKLAKDSPHAGPNFNMAIALATAADQMIFFMVHRAMETPDPDKGQRQIYVIFLLVDEIINVPSDHHPLKNIFMPQNAATPTPVP